MSSHSERQWTRSELVTARMALSEFRNEYGPGREDLAERIDTVLRTGRGDEFEIVDAEPVEAVAERLYSEIARRHEFSGDYAYEVICDVLRLAAGETL